MKRKAVIWLLVVAVFFLAACQSEDHASGTIRAFVMEGEHYRAESGAVSLESGDSALFYIQTDPGYEITGTTYTGEYTISSYQGFTKLELLNVYYPIRVHLIASNYSPMITYMANGGEPAGKEGKEVTRNYDVHDRPRPNVSIGTDLFVRDGYTMTGWNTEADGSGMSVGLGSRVTVGDSLTLYAQWARWTEGSLFSYITQDGYAVITGYAGQEETLVIPEMLGGCPVTRITSYALKGCNASYVVLPKTLVKIEENAFYGALLRELSFFDNIEYITDTCFTGCENFSTLHISAIEDPYGFSFRRESVLADKLDLLITTMGEDRLVFYGGCSVWYNLIGSDVKKAFGDSYTVVNMDLNGVSSSLFQMEIIKNFLTDRDIFIHTPEISSDQQLLNTTKMTMNDDKLWCALEYNYDLVSLVDIRLFESGVLESLRLYLDKKKPGGSYTDIYHDSKGYEYFDDTGSIPYYRDKAEESLVDTILLEDHYLEDLSRLEAEYQSILEKGTRIYVSYACIDIDSVPDEERGNVTRMGRRYEEVFSGMNGVTLISDIYDFLYHDGDFYDTVYHLLTIPAQHCTEVWIRDIKAQMEVEER